MANLDALKNKTFSFGKDRFGHEKEPVALWVMNMPRSVSLFTHLHWKIRGIKVNLREFTEKMKCLPLQLCFLSWALPCYFFFITLFLDKL